MGLRDTRFCGGPVGEDDDLFLHAHTGHQGTRDCAQCSNATRTYPCGIHSHPLCEACIVAKQITPFSLYSLEDLALTPNTYGYDAIVQWPWSPRGQQYIATPRDQSGLPEDILSERCIICVEKAITAWATGRDGVLFPSLLGKILLQDNDCNTLQDLAMLSTTATVIVTHIIHQMRRLLIDFGGFRTYIVNST